MKILRFKQVIYTWLSRLTIPNSDTLFFFVEFVTKQSDSTKILGYFARTVSFNKKKIKKREIRLSN